MDNKQDNEDKSAIEENQPKADTDVNLDKNQYEIKSISTDIKNDDIEDQKEFDQTGFYKSEHHAVLAQSIKVNDQEDSGDNIKKDPHGYIDHIAAKTVRKEPGTPGRKPNQNMAMHSNSEGAFNIIKEAISVDNNIDDDTLIDVHVKNPLKRVIKMLEDIKNKQSTTVSLRFTIPLIALPVILLGAFQLGRAQTICSTRFSSTIGNLKKIAVMAPVENNDSLNIILSFLPSFPKLQKPEELTYKGKTILITPQGQIIDVIQDPSIKLDIYNGIDVIISGMFSPCTNSITLDSVQNITQKN